MLNIVSVLPLDGNRFKKTSIKFSWVLQPRDPWDMSIFLKRSKIIAWWKQSISCSNFPENILEGYYFASKIYAACPFFSFFFFPNNQARSPKLSLVYARKRTQTKEGFKIKDLGTIKYHCSVSKHVSSHPTGMCVQLRSTLAHLNLTATAFD